MTTTLKERQRDVNAAFDALSARAKLGDGVLNKRTEEIAIDAINAINAMNAVLSPESAAAAEKAIGKLRNQLNGAGAPTPTPEPTPKPAPTDPTSVVMPPAPPAPTGDSTDIKTSLREVLDDEDLPFNKAVLKHKERLDDHERRIAALENGDYAMTAGGDSFRWSWALVAFIVIGIVTFIVLGTSGGFTSTVMGTTAVAASVAGILGGITPVIFKKINKKGA